MQNYTNIERVKRKMEYSVKEKKFIDKRNYGIDALRLISMLGVVALHVLGRGGVLANAAGKKYTVCWFLECLAFCAVNCYGIISGYVCYSEEKKKFHYRKYIMMWLQVWFYCVTITGITYIVKPEYIENISLIRVFFPVASNFYWYFTAYTGVFFVMPWLNMFIKERSSKEMNCFIAIIFLVFSCYASVSALLGDPFKLSEGYSFIWLVFLYFIGAWIKKCNIIERVKSGYAYILIFINVCITWYITIYNSNMRPVLISYVSPLMVANAVFLVCTCAKWENGKLWKKIISFFTPAVFGVYLIHVHAIIWGMMENRFAWIAELSFGKILVALVICISGIFVGGLLIEKIRIELFKWLRVQTIIDKITEFILKTIRMLYNKRGERYTK